MRARCCDPGYCPNVSPSSARYDAQRRSRRAALPTGSYLLVVLLGATLLAISAARATADEAADPPVSDTQAVTAPPATAQEIASRMKVPDGFRVQVFASEPMIRQPIAITTDEKGRLWVAENYTYAESSVNFDQRYRDRIIVLEDQDHDGQADTRKVFWDRAEKLTSVAVGFGGVWALCPPKLLFIPDRNGDDVPDGEPQVVLDGWDGESVRHNIANGLAWGPDGWLYGRHGILATSLVGKPGSAPAQRVQINCGMWRYHPTREIFEAVAHGTTNPWGSDFDEHGQLFFINTVIGHLWHVVPGAHFRRMYGVDFNPHLYQLIEQTADHFHWDTRELWSDIRKGMSDSTSQLGGGHAHCGLMIYLGDNWPAKYRNQVFTVNLHGLRLNNDRLERHGAGYVAKHEPDFLRADSPWFRGLELIYGQDGGVFLADWSDIGECHENDGVHRSTGRIFKIVYGEPRINGPRDLSQLDDVALVQLQLHRNDWYVRHARRLLQERAAAGQDMSSARNQLLTMLRESSDVTRQLRALWCLEAIGLEDSFLQQLTGHSQEHLRVWAVRLLTDHGAAESLEKILAERARVDDSGLVRLHIASALQRLPLEKRWSVARELSRHAGDADDLALPLMVWYGIEPAVPVSPDRAASLAGDSRLPIVRRHIARRLATELDEQPEGTAQLVKLLSERADPDWQLDVLEGLAEALRGWQKAPTPAGWMDVAAKLARSERPRIRELAQELSVVFGDGRAIDDLQRLVENGDGEPQSRRQALRQLISAKAPNLRPLLLKLANDRLLAVEAIRGLAAYDDPQIPRMIIDQFPRLSSEGRDEAINTLVARPAFAKFLLAAIQDGRVDRRLVHAYHVRQLRGFDDASLQSDLLSIWGEIRESPAEKKAQIGELKQRLTPDSLQVANLSQGRSLFAKNCATCHRLYGEGAVVGPDLTGSNRQNLDYLLENLVDPNAMVPTDFRISRISLTDGRVLTGVILEKFTRTVSVQTQKERLVIDRQLIDEVVPQNQSLMPEGLLTPLRPEEIRDLVAYLSGKRQVPLPAESE